MKTIILLLMLTLTMSLSSQEYYLQATKMSISDGVSVESFDSDVKMILNIDTKRCIIYSKKMQIIDYEVDREFIDEDDYSVTECVATDSYYKNIKFTLLIHPALNIILVQIIYRDLGYIYKCHLVSEF